MKKIIVGLVAAVAVQMGGHAQMHAQARQNTFFPAREGAVLEYKYFDRRGRALRDEWKNERWMRLTAEEVWLSEGEVVVNVGVANEAFERLKENPIVSSVIGDLSYGDVRATGGEVVMENMQWLFTGLPWMFADMPADVKVPEDMKDQAAHYRLELSATSRLPQSLGVGDSLPDETYRALFVEQLSEKAQAERDRNREEFRNEVALHGGPSFSMPRTMNIEVKATMRNRRVEGRERVTTPAGEFDCWKIAYELVGPEEGIVGMPGIGGRGGFIMIDADFGFSGGFSGGPQVRVGTRCVDYISPEVGLVRREKYTANGKRIEEVTELTGISG
jgi:hypothetical protein